MVPKGTTSRTRNRPGLPDQESNVPERRFGPLNGLADTGPGPVNFIESTLASSGAMHLQCGARDRQSAGALCAV